MKQQGIVGISAVDSSAIVPEPVAMKSVRLAQLFMQHCPFLKFDSTENPVKQSPELLKRINADIKPDKGNRCIGYRFEATGVFGYTFYKAGNKICSVSSAIAPSEPVMISGNGVTWRSDHESDKIFPGLTRNVIDESNGKQIFQIVYKGPGKYAINESISVYCDTGKYTFYCEDKVIAIIKRFSGNSDCPQKPSDTYYDYEPYFEIIADDGINAESWMVILSFPMLHFAL